MKKAPDIGQGTGLSRNQKPLSLAPTNAINLVLSFLNRDDQNNLGLASKRFQNLKKQRDLLIPPGLSSEQKHGQYIQNYIAKNKDEHKIKLTCGLIFVCLFIAYASIISPQVIHIVTRPDFAALLMTFFNCYATRDSSGDYHLPSVPCNTTTPNTDYNYLQACIKSCAIYNGKPLTPQLNIYSKWMNPPTSRFRLSIAIASGSALLFVFLSLYGLNKAVSSKVTLCFARLQAKRNTVSVNNLPDVRVPLLAQVATEETGATPETGAASAYGTV